MSPKHHHEPRKSPYAYSQEAFHTGWTHHSHALTDNFLRAADAVSLADLQHSPLPAAERLDSLQHKLGHLFTHRNLLLLALTHPSGSPNSKVLSWMGDSALNLAVTEQLAGSNIESVGELTEARARLVSRENCCSCARHFGLGELMIIGKSVLISNGGPTDDMLGEAMEAVYGAVYVDGGRFFLLAFPVFCARSPPLLRPRVPRRSFSRHGSRTESIRAELSID